MSKSYKPIAVYWVDSMGVDGWVTNKKMNMNCISYGHLISKDKDSVTIAMNKSLNSENSYGDYMQIPLCSVKKIKKLKE